MYSTHSQNSTAAGCSHEIRDWRFLHFCFPFRSSPIDHAAVSFNHATVVLATAVGTTFVSAAATTPPFPITPTAKDEELRYLQDISTVGPFESAQAEEASAEHPLHCCNPTAITLRKSMATCFNVPELVNLTHFDLTSPLQSKGPSIQWRVIFDESELEDALPSLRHR